MVLVTAWLFVVVVVGLWGQCYHAFPVFSLASNANNLCLPPFPKFTYLERLKPLRFCISQIKYHYSLYLKEQSKLCILMAISISDIMSKKLETFEEMASVQEAAKKMNDKNVSSLVVVDANGATIEAIEVFRI